MRGRFGFIGTVSLALSTLLAACARPPAAGFSVVRARAHVEMLASTIGIRSVGTDANRKAREYIVGQLEQSGFEVRIQEADAVRPEFGQTTHLFNVIAVKAGAGPDAVALVAHYDSPPEGPGAADDGLGVAVCLEAGRLLAARPQPQYSLVIALTDAEEVGLMGAAALVTDPLWQRVRAYVNIEAVGTSGDSLLFETGPGNGWLTRVWARHSRQPFGGSFATEIYKRLNNDTDFTILKRTGVPGLNFAPIGNSYAYHTPLDTPNRLPDATLAQTGKDTVAIVEALDRENLDRRTSVGSTYSDLGGLGAFAIESGVASALAGLALVLGSAVWVRLLFSARRVAGLGRLGLTAVWAGVGLAAVCGCMVAAAWALRSAREVYHPWYAHPSRFFALFAVAGICGGWAVERLSAVLPARFRAHGHPAFVWCLILPVWLSLAAVSTWLAPAASYLVTFPLLAASVALGSIRKHRATAVRVASLAPFVVAVLLWVRPAAAFLLFMVPMFGRLPVITPVAVYPLLLLTAALFVITPVLAISAGWKPGWVRPPFVTTVVLVGFAVALTLAYVAPAYDAAHPKYRVAQYIQDASLDAAYWEVAGNEPGVDLAPEGTPPVGWERAIASAPVSIPVDRPGGPFRFRTRAVSGLAPPVTLSSSVDSQGDECTLAVRVRPREAGATVALTLPAGVRPLDSNPVGAVRNQWWRAIFIAPPRDGAVFRVRLRLQDLPALAGARVSVTTSGLPGGTGQEQLPPWLPRIGATWRARTISILALPAATSD